MEGRKAAQGKRPPAVLVLAGRRSSTLDPMAEARGVSHKCVVPVGGVPMIERVYRRFGVEVRPMTVEDGRLAIDVDNERTHRVAEEMLPRETAS
jgi:molybdopterin-guanine dinucleotide biosynthesis protein A